MTPRGSKPSSQPSMLSIASISRPASASLTEGWSTWTPTLPAISRVVSIASRSGSARQPRPATFARCCQLTRARSSHQWHANGHGGCPFGTMGPHERLHARCSRRLARAAVRGTRDVHRRDKRVPGPGRWWPGWTEFEALNLRGNTVLAADLWTGASAREEFEELEESLDDLDGTADAREAVRAHLRADQQRARDVPSFDGLEVPLAGNRRFDQAGTVLRVEYELSR
jgi:hypothetical protein